MRCILKAILPDFVIAEADLRIALEKVQFAIRDFYVAQFKPNLSDNSY